MHIQSNHITFSIFNPPVQYISTITSPAKESHSPLWRRYMQPVLCKIMNSIVFTFPGFAIKVGFSANGAYCLPQ